MVRAMAGKGMTEALGRLAWVFFSIWIFGMSGSLACIWAMTINRAEGKKDAAGGAVIIRRNFGE